ncbi:MAG: Asp-tRNA(Asn)/Glu-tRNA(Gln) amidotransferase GatCAB subunit B [Candidatus Liptonbacteria bacterium CG11_big_fil_rev_8_21_14_0_20_35_14]|uniref:Aspartyl/glutamyl-tRNA(Asn/Gln) amidotransferase subunit B n=1 Tax=Candidatus Liptonbacteria bacterium CG11_big_fil_rev_8_21_14_0_20_35_14 TaxID=1974634 RepID=A0A2H0N8F1_9BACT|nr:MAG: Asp-tRNA(Asn)/Glu-tRNA(Gln) amidotransferase GatCAB subunit B [Candidatus Liptonbacteria bacterium CG11_big_fil_rev_8_21_14_0_20_35_14]
MKYKAVIGMEVHAELKSERKMFCGCLNNPDEVGVNVNVCPVCLAHPGTLPVANRKPIESMIKINFALHGRLADKTKFSRKNYFYPDLPKGYQITSQPDPFIFGGYVEVDEKKIAIDHGHLEEDTGTSIHEGDYTLVNFNRSGVPLMELVTEPVIESGIEARRFCEELQLILRYLGVSDANMEKGEMRCEVNVSIMPEDFKEFGTKVEIKNLNSFRAVEKSINYEIERHKALLEQSEKVIQETRGWDEIKNKTVAQRKKEDAHDYRYFPEPDLPEFDLRDFEIERLKNDIPELPSEKRKRFIEEYGLSSDQVEVLVFDRDLANYFEQTASELKADFVQASFSSLYNYLVSDLRGLMKSQNISFEELKITPENFVDLILLIEKNVIGSRVAKNVLLRMFKDGSDPVAIVKEEGLEQVSDEGELLTTVKKIISLNNAVVEDYKNGKEKAIKFLVGQAMKELKGKGDPLKLEEIFKGEIK